MSKESDPLAPSAEAGGNGNDSLLTLVVGPYLLCVPTAEVEGIIAPPAMARLPNNDPCFRGVFFHHGRTALVISLRCKFGLSRRTHATSGELVLSDLNGELAAFWVDDVLDAVEGNRVTWREFPPALANGVFDRFGLIDQELYLHTRFERLLDVEPARLAEMLRSLAPQTTPATDASRDQDPTAVSPQADTTRESPTATDRPTATAPGSATAPTRTGPSVSATTGLRARQRAVGTITGDRAVRAARLAGDTFSTAATRGTVQQTYSRAGMEAPVASASQTTNPTPKSGTATLASFAILFTLIVAALLWWWLGTESPAKARTSSVSATGRDNIAGSLSAAPSPSDTSAAHPAAAPAPANVLRVDTSDFVLTVERAPQAANTPAAPVTTTPPEITPPASTKEGWQEIVHVVKRGDTLWDITRKYLGNPFRYPELARLSQIRNPDLIHPGDRIRIQRKTPPAR